MDKVVLYCKSFSRDLDRVANLAESISRYNVDSIPFYVSVPSVEVPLFKNKLPGFVNILADELVYEGNTPGWLQQQIVKSSFWKAKICNNYLCLDSDAYFIKGFYSSDFLFDQESPYTVIHEQKELFSWTASRSQILGFNPKDSFVRDRQKVMELFNRKGKIYDFGPSPVIWSGKVWESLEENYTKPNNLTLEQLITYTSSEFSWYGEALLAFKAVPVYPVEPLFKVFHYPLQVQEYKQQGITERMIAENYMGIIMQSNFDADIKY